NKTVYLDDPVTFFANFTNATNGQAIDNTKASVRALFNNSVEVSMFFNSTINLWQYDVNLPISGTLNWLANATSDFFSNLTANDTISAVGCVNLTNHNGEYNLDGNRTLCYGDYRLNDTGSPGIIIFDSSGITLDCNNSWIYGNLSGTGIFANGKNNIAIRNCKLSNLTQIMAVANSENVSITNTEGFYNYGGINITNSQAVSVSGCKFNLTGGNPISIKNTPHSSVSNCIMYSSTYLGSDSPFPSAAEVRAESSSYLAITNLTSISNNNVDAAVTILRSNFTSVNTLKIYNSKSLFGLAYGDIFAFFGTPVYDFNNSVTNLIVENLSAGANATNLSEEFVTNESLTSVFLDYLAQGAGLASVTQVNLKASNLVIKNASICVGELGSSNDTYTTLQLLGCNVGFGKANLNPTLQKVTFESSSVYNSTFGIATINTFLDNSSSIRNLNLYNSSYVVAAENSNLSGAIRNIAAYNSATGIFAVHSYADITSSNLNISKSVDLNNQSIGAFINVTYNKAVPYTINEGSYFGVFWFLNAEVRDSISNLLQGAVVTAKDVFGNEVFSLATNSLGRIATQTLLEFYRNSTSAVYFTNYTFNVSKEQYLFPSLLSRNITQSTFLPLVMLSNQSIIVYSPANSSYYNTKILNLTYSVLYSSPDKCWFYNTTNVRVELPGCINTTFNATDGLKNISLFANDTFGNMSFSKIFFFVDTVFPVISDINISGLGNTTATINWTTSEETNSTLSYGVSSSDLNNLRLDFTYNLTHSVSLVGLTNHQIYYYKITSCDRAGNCGTEGPISFETERGDYQPQQLHIPEEDIIIQELVASELTATPQKTSLTPGSKYIFTIDSERHSIKLKTVYKDDYAVFEISSTPFNVSVKEGQTVDVDVNMDGTADMKLSVTDIFLTKVTFELIRIAPPAVQAPEEVPPVVEEPTGPPIVIPETPEEVTEVEPTFFEKYGMLMILVIIIVAVLVAGGAILLQQKKIPAVVPKKEVKKAEPPKMSHMQALMSKVYEMLKDKKTDEDVRRMLSAFNLDENIIKSIIYEMRTKDNRIDQLIKYSKFQFNKGKTVDEVKKDLEKAGWAKNIVDLATEE
ncbi:hypothetical protein KY308_01870, partial [Candidatus Woesearchaeota archaeon]|nr:hypothetical protein [Candidatus Woesearchaeota archaeon]